MYIYVHVHYVHSIVHMYIMFVIGFSAEQARFVAEKIGFSEGSIEQVLFV